MPTHSSTPLIFVLEEFNPSRPLLIRLPRWREWKKHLPSNAGDLRDWGLIPGSGSSPRGGHSNPLQYSSLENPTDREAWWATVQSRKEPDTTEAT